MGWLRRLRLQRRSARPHDAGAERGEPVQAWPPGHFYSPIPSLAEVRSREAAIFGTVPETLPGVELNEAGQRSLFEALKQYYPQQPFGDQPTRDRRFGFDNPNFSYGEAIILYCMMRHLRPRRVIEVGSGYSSSAILDINELFFENAIDCTFIDPYPDLMLSMLRPGDLERVTVLAKAVQDVAVETFAELMPHDILLIDSTHISKVGSDVNSLFFQVLPRIRPGVYVHIHDICYPFQYPKEWIYQGRAWNEAYLVRAFLQYNRAFEISFFNSFFGERHRELLLRDMPLCARNPGSRLWLKRA